MPVTKSYEQVDERYCRAAKATAKVTADAKKARLSAERARQALDAGPHPGSFFSRSTSWRQLKKRAFEADAAETKAAQKACAASAELAALSRGMAEDAKAAQVDAAGRAQQAQTLVSELTAQMWPSEAVPAIPSPQNPHRHLASKVNVATREFSTKSWEQHVKRLNSAAGSVAEYQARSDRLGDRYIALDKRAAFYEQQAKEARERAKAGKRAVNPLQPGPQSLPPNIQLPSAQQVTAIASRHQSHLPQGTRVTKSASSSVSSFHPLAPLPYNPQILQSSPQNVRPPNNTGPHETQSSSRLQASLHAVVPQPSRSSLGRTSLSSLVSYDSKLSLDDNWEAARQAKREKRLAEGYRARNKSLSRQSSGISSLSGPPVEKPLDGLNAHTNINRTSVYPQFTLPYGSNQGSHPPSQYGKRSPTTRPSYGTPPWTPYDSCSPSREIPDMSPLDRLGATTQQLMKEHFSY